MTLMSTSVIADVPNVAADIAPIHSLVSRVMDGVGAPKLIVQSGASPHGYRLRPSEAKALQDADHVFWMGEELTPWLDSAIGTLASKASVTTLLDQQGVILHDFREGALFEAHDHSAHGDDDHDDHDDHKDHDDHDDHDDLRYFYDRLITHPLIRIGIVHWVTRPIHQLEHLPIGAI